VRSEDHYLSQLYAQRGVNLRKHTGEYPGWTERAKTVVDLTAKERRLLDREGEAAFEKHLRAKGQYPFPALSIRRLKPLHITTQLVAQGLPSAMILVPEQSHYLDLARRLQREIEKATRCALPIESDVDFRFHDLRRRHAIVLGGAHENRAAAILTDRYYLNADKALPGPRGMLIRTVHNPANGGHNALQICCGNRRHKEALEEVMGAMRLGSGDALLGPVFVVDRDPASSPSLNKKRNVVESLAKMTARWDPSRPLPIPKRAADLVEPVAACYDGGTRRHDHYNRAAMNVFNAAADIYSRTADRDYLELYLGLVWEMMLYYCNTAGGASIICDMEFDLWPCMIHWDAYEEDHALSEEQRLILTNFLLASTEMCAGYKAERWPTPPGRMRHNHETFGALTLHFAGRYFSDYYDLPVARDWLDIARECFRGPIERHFKFRENANMYQWLAPAHLLIYSRATERRRFISSGNLAKVAQNIVITTDNFGYPCDFGDAGAPISGGGVGLTLLEAAAGIYGEAEWQWVAERTRSSLPNAVRRDLVPSLVYLPGSTRLKPSRPKSDATQQKMPLDDHIRREYAPQVPRARAYDKIAFRESWSDQAQYLLLEGYSAGSHSHRDQNAVIRFNQLGRVWIVDNGYGKRAGVKSLGKAFSTRELGPEDHNTIQLIPPGGGFVLPPPLCELELMRDLGDVAVVQSRLRDFAEGDWLRTVVWAKGRLFLIADQVNVGRKLNAVRCQWNMLGRLSCEGGLGVCEQDGVKLFLHWDPSLKIRQSTYSNASWDHELKPAVYPHAAPPVQKLNLVRRNVEAGSAVEFATLFYASKGRSPSFELRHEGPGALEIRGRRLKRLQGALCTPSLRMDCADGRIELHLGSSLP